MGQRVLALDLSTKTGWSCLDSKEGQDQPVLVAYGVLRAPTEDFKDQAPYPIWCQFLARHQASRIRSIWLEYDPDVVVIEHIDVGHDATIQLGLSFIHFTVLEMFAALGVTPVYIMPGAWRKALDQRLTPKQKAANAVLAKAKRNGNVKEVKAKTGVKGRVTKKHVTVAWVNAMFGLSLKIGENDIADAISQAAGYLAGAWQQDGIRKPKDKIK